MCLRHVVKHQAKYTAIVNVSQFKWLDHKGYYKHFIISYEAIVIPLMNKYVQLDATYIPNAIQRFKPMLNLAARLNDESYEPCPKNISFSRRKKSRNITNSKK